jgi:hypothetical protein
LQELSKSYSEHVDITPPQMFAGENLKSIPPTSLRSPAGKARPFKGGMKGGLAFFLKA